MNRRQLTPANRTRCQMRPKRRNKQRFELVAFESPNGQRPRKSHTVQIRRTSHTEIPDTDTADDAATYNEQNCGPSQTCTTSPHTPPDSPKTNNRKQTRGEDITNEQKPVNGISERTRRGTSTADGFSVDDRRGFVQGRRLC